MHRYFHPLHEPASHGSPSRIAAAKGVVGPRRLGGCGISRRHTARRGTISIISVFTLLLLAMLLGMVMNVGRQIDNKVKMQQAADAAAYGGGIVMARGMNTLAFTNHLLCDVFALTAFMREARDRHGDALVPEVLAAWSEAAETFSKAKFAKFAALAPAIQAKLPDEQQMVETYSAWAYASSEAILPMLEEILAEEMIPEYQRALVATTPQLARTAAFEISMRHGVTSGGAISTERGPMQATLWGAGLGAPLPVLPVVDPVDPSAAETYRVTAREQRRNLAFRYLDMWNNEALVAFHLIGKMSQFANMWEGFTCGQLEQLLAENYDRNLPFQISLPGEQFIVADPRLRNALLESDFMFVSMVYWPPLTEMAATVFRNPTEGDNITFAQVAMFIPRNRLIRVWISFGGEGGGSQPSGMPIGGVPGEFVELPPADMPPVPDQPQQGGGGDAGGEWVVVRQGLPQHWDLLNQGWQAQLVPATHPALPAMLQTPPSFDGPHAAQEVSLPDLSRLSNEDLSVLSHH